MEKSVLEKFRSDLESAGIEHLNLRIEGGNKTITDNDDAKIILKDDYVLGIEFRNNHGADPNANFNIVAVPYDNIDNAKAFEITAKQLIDFLNVVGVELDDDMKEFISTHGNRVSIGQKLNSTAAYGEIHNAKGQVVLTTPLPGRVTQAVTTDKPGVVEVDPESPI